MGLPQTEFFIDGMKLREGGGEVKLKTRNNREQDFHKGKVIHREWASLKKFQREWEKFRSGRENRRDMKKTIVQNLQK